MARWEAYSAVGTGRAFRSGMTQHSTLTAHVITCADLVTAELRDSRADTFRLFDSLSEQERETLAQDAWTIGLRALGNAWAQAQEARLQDVGTSFIADIDRQLRQHVETQQQTISSVLGRFFDPQDGHVAERLTAFLNDQGVLARQLEKYLGPQNSVLAEALARQVGESSPLFKKLSPTDSEGLVKTLEAQLGSVAGRVAAVGDGARTRRARERQPQAQAGPLPRGAARHRGHAPGRHAARGGGPGHPPRTKDAPVWRIASYSETHGTSSSWQALGILIRLALACRRSWVTTVIPKPCAWATSW